MAHTSRERLKVLLLVIFVMTCMLLTVLNWMAAFEETEGGDRGRANGVMPIADISGLPQA